MKTQKTLSGCPLVLDRNGARELPRFNWQVLTTVLAFGMGLMAAAI